MTTPRLPSLLAVAALTVVALAGCGSSSKKSSSTAAAAPTGDAVTIKDFKYAPPALTVKAGTKLTFSNEDNAAHTATSKQSGVFDTDKIVQGQKKTITIAKPGAYAYFCEFHPFMKGAIVVQ